MANTTITKKEKTITWRMYFAGYIAAFVLILATQFESPFTYGDIIVSGLVAFPAALFICSGYNMVSK